MYNNLKISVQTRRFNSGDICYFDTIIVFAVFQVCRMAANYWQNNNVFIGKDYGDEILILIPTLIQSLFRFFLGGGGLCFNQMATQVFFNLLKK